MRRWASSSSFLPISPASSASPRPVRSIARPTTRTTARSRSTSRRLGATGASSPYWPAEAIGSVAPSLREQDCTGGSCASYAWEQGTSMATPNAAGVAALIVSQLGHPHMAPDNVEKILEQTATPLACPNPPTVTYDVPPGILASNTATCQGSAKSNGFYGSGLVDALRAVTAK